MKGIGFRDPASPIMEGIIDLHNYIFFFLIMIFVFVFVIFLNIIIDFGYRFNNTKNVTQEDLDFRYDLFLANKLTHNTALELVWTIVPTIILIWIAIPSFILLYAMDEVIQPTITFKAIGHQWYWSYEYSYITSKLTKRLNFDSNMVYEDDLNLGELRLLSVDKAFMLPIDTHINVIVTSYDVLHSFALPALGFKVDAVPGRLNRFPLFIKRQGVYYGQCSELCGVSHGFMPIVIKGVTFKNWHNWVQKNLN